MQRVTGNREVAPMECINPRRGVWRVRWDVVDRGDSTAEYMEEEFVGKPSTEQVRQLITEWHNAQTDKRILTGFTWREMPVWLSPENQSNFKAAYDLAHQSSGATLPVTFKLGESADGEPLYHTFTEMAEFTDFIHSAFAHVQVCLTQGWRAKDSINFKNYE